MQIDEIVSMIQKFIEIRRVRTLGCINFRPLDVVETVIEHSAYGDGDVRKYNIPTTYNLINYVLRVLSSYKLLFFTVLSDKVKYVLCRDSPIWNKPEKIREYIQRYETEKRDEYYLDVYENEGLVLFTTNVDDDELFTKVINAIRKTVKDGFDVMSLAKLLNGKVVSGSTNYRIYIGIRHRDKVRAVNQQHIVKITPIRKIILLCIADGANQYDKIIDCVREKRPSKYDDVYSIVLNALRTLCLHQVLICDGNGYFINPVYLPMVQGFVKT
ncbi:MAG: hypothetical protein L7H04_07330 [Vulcanisaeta sp.]|nr:hypothetical protein [Vulcanisaeta sp.]